MAQRAAESIDLRFHSTSVNSRVLLRAYTSLYESQMLLGIAEPGPNSSRARASGQCHVGSSPSLASEEEDIPHELVNV